MDATSTRHSQFLSRPLDAAKNFQHLYTIYPFEVVL